MEKSRCQRGWKRVNTHLTHERSNKNQNLKKQNHYTSMHENWERMGSVVILSHYSTKFLMSPSPTLPARHKSRVSVLNQNFKKLGTFLTFVLFCPSKAPTEKKFYHIWRPHRSMLAGANSGVVFFSAHDRRQIPMMLSQEKIITMNIFFSRCFTSGDSKGVGSSESKALSTPRLHLGQVLTSGNKVVRVAYT
jgi:hypothetical protein